MSVCAVICEYNPFHKGHARQFRLIRDALGADTAILCLMSGPFVQRGEPAIFLPLVRAQAALEAGADLVLENPLPNVLRSAEGYARGSAELLQDLGCVTHLSFGCECGSADALMNLAKLLRTPSFQQALRPELDRGLSFASARQRAVEALGGDGTLLTQPNNILGVEYCKALLELRSPIQPLAVRRTGDYHARDLDPDEPSATALRTALLSGEIQTKQRLHSWRFGERAVLAILRTKPREAYAQLPHGEEGLWSRFQRACLEYADLEAILEAAKSKRYARTRLQRLMSCAYLGIDRDILYGTAPYVRVLGFSQRGQELLHTLRTTAARPLVHAGARAPDRSYEEMEARWRDLYELLSQDVPIYGTLRRERVIPT